MFIRAKNNEVHTFVMEQIKDVEACLRIRCSLPITLSPSVTFRIRLKILQIESRLCSLPEKIKVVDLKYDLFFIAGRPVYGLVAWYE